MASSRSILGGFVVMQGITAAATMPERPVSAVLSEDVPPSHEETPPKSSSCPVNGLPVRNGASTPFAKMVASSREEGVEVLRHPTPSRARMPGAHNVLLAEASPPMMKCFDSERHQQ